MTYRNYYVQANGRIIAQFMRECDAEEFANHMKAIKPHVTYVVQWVELGKNKALY